jgi:sugar O-acyltransferase (sialic acid O-acetyltransferase NeuD family)
VHPARPPRRRSLVVVVRAAALTQYNVQKNDGDGLRALPADCRRILIVGAGGFGREVATWLRDAWPRGADTIAGFLSDDLGRLAGFEVGIPMLGTVVDYAPRAGDYLVLAIGVPYTRRTVAESLVSRGGRFLTLVHPKAIVADNAILGDGCVVCPYAIVSDSARLGTCVLLNYHTSLGHEAYAGHYSVLSPYATLGGGARIEDEGFLGLHASIGPGITLGARSKVSANSCVLSCTPADSLVFGVPGRVTPRIAVRGE